MSRLTPLKALRTLSHKLKLHEFPECESGCALESILYLGARIQELKNDAIKQGSHNEETLAKCHEDYEFVELVLARLRTYIDLARPLPPEETISAMSALEYVAGQLVVSNDGSDLDQINLPNLAHILAETG
ncbi:hypothetical protein AB1K70_00770 [Bremerella sp. JC770]|uniref:hypothetical protein n=1 Tax=Bremerella sp. JC770 TaxID=3232137 RepID=UPI003457678F